METPHAHIHGHVLLIDDNPDSLRQIHSCLKHSEFVVECSSNPSWLEDVFRKYPTHFFDCVIIPFLLEKTTGIDLKKEIQAIDDSLSIIMLTETDKPAILQDLSFVCLRKPFDPSELIARIIVAIKHTRESRKFKETQESLNQAGEAIALFSDFSLQSEMQPFVKILFHPRHELGGDCIDFFKLSEDKYLLFLGDVSGHDVQSAVVASYFLGLLKGFIEGAKRPVEDALTFFNDLLIANYEKSASAFEGIRYSMACCALKIDYKNNLLYIQNNALPFPCLVSDCGSVMLASSSNMPLGWMENADSTPQIFNVQNGAFLYAFSDGIVDYAYQLQTNIYALLFVLFEGTKTPHDIFEAIKDDILCVRLQLNKKVSEKELPVPLFYEVYTGNEYANIDVLQEGWENSLRFALGNLIEDRLDNILLCCREGLLNAQLHGCQSDPNKYCCLQIAYYKDKRCLRVRIDDPGKGFSSTQEKTIEETLANSQFPNTEEHNGLGLNVIKSFADKLSFEREGATLVIDFFC